MIKYLQKQWQKYENVSILTPAKPQLRLALLLSSKQCCAKAHPHRVAGLSVLLKR